MKVQDFTGPEEAIATVEAAMALYKKHYVRPDPFESV